MKKEYINLSEALKDILGSKNFGLFVNRSSTRPLDADRNVILSLETRGRHKEYACLNVEVVHKQNGAIANQIFNFDDYFSNGNAIKEYSTNNIVWVIDTPTDEQGKELLKEIIEWIEIWD